MVVVEADERVDDAEDDEDLVGAAEIPTYDDPNPVSMECVEWSLIKDKWINMYRNWLKRN